jgi:hypothetical protein
LVPGIYVQFIEFAKSLKSVEWQGNKGRPKKKKKKRQLQVYNNGERMRHLPEKHENSRYAKQSIEIIQFSH